MKSSFRFALVTMMAMIILVDVVMPSSSSLPLDNDSATGNSKVKEVEDRTTKAVHTTSAAAATAATEEVEEVVRSFGTIPNHNIKRSKRSYATDTKNSIEITKIEPTSREHERRLLTCDDYQYQVKIKDVLYMYYVANPTTKRISMKIEYLGVAWLSFGTNQYGRGDMIGSEAWMALPLVPVGPANPGTYEMTTETVDGVRLSPVQMLLNSKIEQTVDTTSMSFTRKYSDFFLVNQPLNLTENEFVWAYGYSNTYDAEEHEGAGHFGMKIEECTTPADEIIEVNVQKRRRCGILNLSVFCPFITCGFFGRLLDICKD